MHFLFLYLAANFVQYGVSTFEQAIKKTGLILVCLAVYVAYTRDQVVDSHWWSLADNQCLCNRSSNTYSNSPKSFEMKGVIFE